jgi:hypothetical protein
MKVVHRHIPTEREQLIERLKQEFVSDFTRAQKEKLKNSKPKNNRA